MENTNAVMKVWSNPDLRAVILKERIKKMKCDYLKKMFSQDDSKILCEAHESKFGSCPTCEHQVHENEAIPFEDVDEGILRVCSACNGVGQDANGNIRYDIWAMTDLILYITMDGQMSTRI